jgi:hypothetical protein
VEQKNATLVRQYFGTIRLDTAEQVKAMNALYDKMWLYYNFFQPVMHLQEKICQDDHVVRHWALRRTKLEIELPKREKKRKIVSSEMS